MWITWTTLNFVQQFLRNYGIYRTLRNQKNLKSLLLSKMLLKPNKHANTSNLPGSHPEVCEGLYKHHMNSF